MPRSVMSTGAAVLIVVGSWVSNAMAADDPATPPEGLRGAAIGVPIAERARPVQLFIWYPARPEPAASHLSYADYVHLANPTMVP